MVNIKKVAYQIKFDGMYNTVLNEIEESLNKVNLTVEEIEEILIEKEHYLWEYKELNRYGELSSVHAKNLDIKEDDKDEVKVFKSNLNKNVQTLRNIENFEVNSKNSAYSIWVGSVGVMVIFMAHNVIALFSEIYTTHGSYVYTGYAIVLGLTYWAYRKVKDNHERQHLNYNVLHKETRELITIGLENNYFTYDEFYESI